MSISVVESITINGSQNFLGGQIFDLKFQRGFNGQPSTVEAKIIAESRKYQIPDLNYTSPYHIALGTVYSFDFFAYRYCISDSSQGRIMTVYFKDIGITKLSRYWIAPVGQVCNHPNVIFVGTIPNGANFNSVNQAQGVSQSTPFPISPTSVLEFGSTEKSVPFGSFNYSEFQLGTAFLGIPNIPSNNLVRITQEGSVLDIFNYFMNLYGYSWYIDAGVIKLVDLKRPTVLSDSLINSLETHVKRLSSNICTSIDNNYVRGAVALDDGENDDANDPNSGSFVLSAAKALWDGTDNLSTDVGINLDGQQTNVNFLGAQLLGGYGPKAALYAAHSPQLYFAYLLKKYDLETAIQALGFTVYGSFAMNNLPSTASALTTNQCSDSSSPFTSTTCASVVAMVATSLSDEGSQSFYDRDRLLGEVLLKGYYSIKDINPSVQWGIGSPTALNPNTKFSEIPQFNGLIFDNSTIASTTTQNVWVLTFPTVIEYNFNATFLERINRIYPQKLPFAAKLFSSDETFNDSKFFIIRVDANDVEQITIPELKYPPSSILYVQGTLNSTDIRLGNVTQKDIPLYGLGGRKIIACNIPAVKSETSSLEIVTFENIQDKVPNVKTFIAQNSYSKNNPDVQYEVTIRGISLGFVITPEQGLENISVSLDENGYNTSYSLSSRRELPPNPDSLKGPKQFSSIT